MSDTSSKRERVSDIDWSALALSVPAEDPASKTDMFHVEHELDVAALAREGVSPELEIADSPSSFHMEHPQLRVVESPGAGEDVAYPEMARVLYLPLDTIEANRHQPRQHFDEEDLADLSRSIKETGVLQPIVVRPAGEDGRWEIVMGERRFRASQLAGMTSIPALIRQVDDRNMLKEALIENLQRANLDPLEEASAIQALIDDWDVSHEEAGKALGKTRVSITHALSLLRLPEPVQRRIASGVLTRGHAKVLVGVKDPQQTIALAERVVAEGLTVRDLTEAVTLLETETPSQRKRASRSGGGKFSYPAAVECLEDALDTKVKVEASRRGRGRIIVEFSDIDDLLRLIYAVVPNADLSGGGVEAVPAARAKLPNIAGES